MKGSNGLLRSLEKRATELFVDDKNGGEKHGKAVKPPYVSLELLSILDRP